MENNTKNMFEAMSNMQKQAAETFTQATEQMKKNFDGPGMIDTDFFKKWYDTQMAFFNQSAGTTPQSNPMEFFNTWMKTQMESAKTWFESSQNGFGGTLNGENKQAYSKMLEMFNNWTSTMSNTYNEMLKSFENGTGKEAFSGMFNNAEMYMKSFELWMPMFKSIQDKSFTPEFFREHFNASRFKEILDSIFNMQPDFMKNMSEESKANLFKMLDANKNIFDSVKGFSASAAPDANAFFGQMFSSYNEGYNTLNNAIAPFMKLMTPGTEKANLETTKDIFNGFNIFNMKNSQMKYMMYVTGTKAMEEVAESVYSKLRNGENMNDFMAIYQEWLNINDKNFVKLFESEEYSKMQSEVNSIGMKLKRQVDLQMEKTMGNLPLINRSEMDELYKTLHELKKKISVLEKQIDGDDAPEQSEAKAPAAAAKKSAKNS